MLLLYKVTLRFLAVVASMQICVTLTAQHLVFTSANTKIEAPLSIRPVVSGYLPANVNLLGDNYRVKDLRNQLTGRTICSLPDSVLRSSIDPVLLITNEFFCAYDAIQVVPGSIILVPVDSNELSTASLPHFDEEDDTFGPVYIFAISNEAMNELDAYKTQLDSIVFNPDGNPVFSNYASTPTYHLAEDMSVVLPCRNVEPYTVAITLVPDHSLEVTINADSSNVYFPGFLEFGRGFFDVKSFRSYSEEYNQNNIQFSVVSGELGDHISFKPRCEGIDSFLVSIVIEKVDTSTTCIVQTEFPFEIFTEDETLESFVNNDGFHFVNLPFSSQPLAFVSAVDSLEELPSGRPPKYRPYYAYDNWFFDLVVASREGCDALNSDLNGGGVITNTKEIADIESNTSKCSFEQIDTYYRCGTHKDSEVKLLSHFFPLRLYLPSTFDVVQCKNGDQSQIVPALRN